MDNQGQFIRTSSRLPLPWIAGAIVIIILIGSASYYFLVKKPGSGYSGAAPATNVTRTKFSGEVQPTPNPTTIEKQKKGEEVSVFLIPSGFIPADMTIKAGANVTWTNRSDTAGNVSSTPHPAHTDYAALNLGDFGPGKSVSLTFSAPGTYKYHNHLNPSQTGAITVVQ